MPFAVLKSGSSNASEKLVKASLNPMEASFNPHGAQAETAQGRHKNTPKVLLHAF